MSTVSPIELVVAEGEQGLRLEQFIRARIPGISRGSVRRLLERRQVLVGGRFRPKGHRVRAGESVVVASAARDERPVPQPELPLEVLAETDAVVVLNKPAGIPTHPLVPGETDTLANALAARHPECVEAGSMHREGGLVHRLDWSTSGAIVAARDRETYGWLRGLFSAGKVLKSYIALVEGRVRGPGAVHSRLRTLPGDRRRMEVVQRAAAAREAVTQYQPLEVLAHHTIVQVSCRTGRRHQVRVHLAHVGHPLVGDETYGGPALDGVRGAFLHASRLLLVGTEHEFVAPLPGARAALLRSLGAALPR